MSKDTKAGQKASRPARQRSWEDVVAQGVKDGTVIGPDPVDEDEDEGSVDERSAGAARPAPAGDAVELIVENFHGVKRATGVGPTHAKAREALVDELKKASGSSGPVLPEPGQIADSETAEALNQREKGE